MPIYTRETLRTDKLPWVDIDDFEFLVLARPAGTPGPAIAQPAQPAQAANGHGAFWGTYQVTPDPTSREFKPVSPRERLVVIDGEVCVECEYGRFTMKSRD
jgi:hypothetical protein